MRCVVYVCVFVFFSLSSVLEISKFEYIEWSYLWSERMKPTIKTSRINHVAPKKTAAHSNYMYPFDMAT